MSTFLHNLHATSIAARTFYLVLMTAIVTSFMAATSKMINSAWKIYYSYQFIVCSVYFIYLVLRLAGVLEPTSYRLAASWLVIFVAFCLVWPSMLHVWERKELAKQLKSDP